MNYFSSQHLVIKTKGVKRTSLKSKHEYTQEENMKSTVRGVRLDLHYHFGALPRNPYCGVEGVQQKYPRSVLNHSFKYTPFPLTM